MLYMTPTAVNEIEFCRTTVSPTTEQNNDFGIDMEQKPVRVFQILYMKQPEKEIGQNNVSVSISTKNGNNSCESFPISLHYGV